jgi:hypothetical protein
VLSFFNHQSDDFKVTEERIKYEYFLIDFPEFSDKIFKDKT